MWPPTYRAQTVIVVDPQLIPDQYVAGTVQTELSDRLASLTKQVLSSTRLQGVIQEFDLYPKQRAKESSEEVVERMRADIRVIVDREWSRDRPGAFTVSYSARTAVLAADVANRLAGLFVEENLKAREANAQGTTSFMGDELEHSKAILDELEARVGEYKRQHNGELPQQEPLLLSNLAQLRMNVQDEQEAIGRAQENRELLETALSMLPPEAAAGDSSPARAEAETEVASEAAGPSELEKQLTQQLKEARTVYTDSYPEVRRLTSLLEQEKAAEREASNTHKNARRPAPAANGAFEAGLIARQQRARGAELRVQIRHAEQEIAGRRSAIENLKHEIGETQARLAGIPLREQEMATLTRDYEMSQANYRSLLNKNMSVRLSADMEHRQQAERFTVLDSAQPPSRPAQPDRRELSAFACLLGLILAAGTALLVEWRRNKVLGEWDLPPHIEILGRVPRLNPAPAVSFLGLSNSATLPAFRESITMRSSREP
jgi:polysaccharide chain length determinant protein (PEP-CTERM system associated)